MIKIATSVNFSNSNRVVEVLKDFDYIVISSTDVDSRLGVVKRLDPNKVVIIDWKSKDNMLNLLGFMSESADIYDYSDLKKLATPSVVFKILYTRERIYEYEYPRVWIDDTPYDSRERASQAAFSQQQNDRTGNLKYNILRIEPNGAVTMT